MTPRDMNNHDESPRTPDTNGPLPAKLPRPSMQMINDIQGMQRPLRPTDSSPQQPVVSPPSHPNDHLLEAPHELLLDKGDDASASRNKHRLLKGILAAVIGLLVIAVLAVAAAMWWYQQQLQPVEPGSAAHVRVTIEAGTAPSAIGTILQQNGVIRSKTAFSIYTKLSGTENQLKAGAYNLSKGNTTQQIVDHLVSGKQDTFTIMFLPGDTLANHRKKLLNAGYKEADIDAAFEKTYDRPLFAGRPASADLEGYIFGDTYEFASDATVEDILNRTFDEYEQYVTKNNVAAALKEQNLTLYQGITLASIVQREVTNKDPNTPTADQEQVARVFLNRMVKGMTLGSDVTYQYAARKLGVEPTPTLDSPYNTRIHTGLPPGPISSPGLGALLAVAHPGTNDYLFFLSGDDDVTYFAKTDAEHQKNIVEHCKKKCLIN